MTLSRQHGSGGSELARSIADALDWRVVGREIVQRIAAELRISEEEVAARDERVQGFIERIGTQLSGAFPELVPPPFPPTRVDDDTVRVLCEGVLREAVRLGPVVVVGHGGQCLFGRRDDALHLRIVAPLDDRVRRIRTRDGVAEAAAREEAASRDRERAAYLRHHYGRAWDDPELYHAVLNLGRLEPKEAVRFVTDVVSRPSLDDE